MGAPVAAPTKAGTGLTGSRRLRLLIGLLGAALLIAAVYASTLIIRRQDTLRDISRFSGTWLFAQGAVELARLEAAVAEAGLAGADADEVQLRLDIVANRITVLRQGEAARIVAADPELQAAVDAIDAAMATAAGLMDHLDDPTARRRVIEALQPLNITMPRLAAAIYARDIHAVGNELEQLDRLYTTFTIVLFVLFIFGFGLIGLVLWHNRLLQSANAEVRSLVGDLRRTGDELSAANAQVRRAMDDVQVQITVLRERDLALNVQNARFDAALNNMAQALCMVDAEQRLIVCNARFTDLFGLGPEAVRPGTPITEVYAAMAAAGRFDPALIGNIATEQVALSLETSPREFLQESEEQAVAVAHRPMGSGETSGRGTMAGGGWVATYEDVSERRRVEARIRFMAHHDALTSLPNRLLFRERMETALVRQRRGPDGIAVLCLDLDHFKNVNDTLGHPAGDALLRQVTDRLRQCVRDGDVVARLGGDEFAILQTQVAQPQGAEALARRLVEAVQAPFDLQGQHAVVGLSIGIALADSAGPADQRGGPDILLRDADTALYRAKAAGRGTWRFFEAAMNVEQQARRAIEMALREAIRDNALWVEYQPVHNLQSDRISGFEALIRWMHPDLGLVPPADFIPIAEEIGLIAELGEWMLRTACAEAAHWPDHLRVAVNLSPMQFASPRLQDAILDALRDSALAPWRLELEITESALLTQSDRVLAVLHALRSQRIRTVLDDFGTGYSALSYLRSFPFDKIKIDQSFVRDLETRPDSAAIVTSIIDLAGKLGMSTTAEGVETIEQVRRLRLAGCTEAQGFYYSRPVPAAELGGLLGGPTEGSANGLRLVS